MAQWLQADGALWEDSSSVPRTHIRWFTTLTPVLVNSTSLFDLHSDLHTCAGHEVMQMFTHSKYF